MRYLVLFMAWITPAIIASMLGWQSIWGTGSAFIDYLIPMPVAGGVLHVPSFVLMASIVLTLNRWPQQWAVHIPLIALGIVLLSQTLQLRFDRLITWITTDYQVANNMPLKFRGNPLLLFISCDATWLAIYALIKGYRSPIKHWLALPLIPISLIALALGIHTLSGPSFERGLSMPTKVRGDTLRLMYTSTPFQANAYLAWYKEQTIVGKPQDSINDQHLSLVFMDSMQAAKYGKMDQTESIVATLCDYEEEATAEIHQGYYDCFTPRKNYGEQLQETLESIQTELGRDVDFWLAQAKLCQTAPLPESLKKTTNLTNMCRSLQRNYNRTLNKWSKKYGDNSAQVQLLKSSEPRAAWN